MTVELSKDANNLVNNDNWEGRQVKDIRKEITKEINECSSCQYWKGKSGCHFWGDKPCSKHHKKITRLEKEIKEATGKEVWGVITDSELRIVKKPPFNQLFNHLIKSALKTPPLKKKKKKNRK